MLRLSAAYLERVRIERASKGPTPQLGDASVTSDRSEMSEASPTQRQLRYLEATVTFGHLLGLTTRSITCLLTPVRCIRIYV